MNSLCHKYLNQNILPFVGREAELSQLRQLFHEFLEEGESKYTLITGESGSGKSRLVREFEEYLAQEFGDASIIVHARYLEGNAAALTPIVNAFTATLAHQENLKQLLRALKLLKPDHVEATSIQGIELSDTEPSVSDGAPPLQLLLDSLSEIATRFPLVLILEDVHNVEDLPLFDQFFLGLSSAAKFVIFTERVGSSFHAAGPLKGAGVPKAQGRSSEQLMREIALREEHTSGVIPLANLRKRDVNRLFHILFVIEPSDPLQGVVMERTDGRPLSLRTMLRQLVSTGVLQYDQGVWSESSTESADDPGYDIGEEEAVARFQREIERLNEYEQIVLTHGALLGEQFDLRLLRRLIHYRLGKQDLSEELFQRAIDLLTFKSIIRRATPSIYLYPDPNLDAYGREAMDAWCYEFSHQHFWNTALDSARIAVTGHHELIPAIVSIAGLEHLPLYSSAFLSITGMPFGLSKNVETLERVGYFVQWAAAVVKSLWSIEPQQCLKFLTSIRHIRDEITWKFGPDLGESGMSALLDLHSLLVEAFLRTGSPIEAERDLEHAAVLEKFIRSAKSYSRDFQGMAKGKVATLRAILHAGRTSYVEFERCANEARHALANVGISAPPVWSVSSQKETPRVSEVELERARLLTLLARTKAESLLNTGKFKEADALIEHGMPMAQLLVDSRFDEYSLYYRAAVNSKLKQDQNEQAGELTQQIISLAHQRGNTLVETTFLFQAALAAFSMGKLVDATRYCDLGILNGRRYGIRFVEIMCNLWRIIIAGVQQDIEKIKECSAHLAVLVEDARVVAQAPNLLQRISLIEGRATAMNFLGRHHAALEFADEAIQLARSHQHDAFAAWAHNEKALALIGLGRFEEALTVATACINLAGEQRIAERTARTALIMAYAGLGRFEEAQDEADLVRTEYNERNPYYLRFALAEARLFRLLARRTDGATRNQTERQSFRVRLVARVSEMIEIVDFWQAPLLRDQIQKEFEDIIPRKVNPEKIVPWKNNDGEAAFTQEKPVQPKIRLYTFGSLASGPISIGEYITLNGNENNGDVSKRDRPRDRDTKVRQLISLLIVARAGTPEVRTGSQQGSTIERNALIDALWPDVDSTNINNVLYTTVKRARTLLGSPDSIIITEDGYSLSPMVVTDCEEVLHHYAEARQARKKNAQFSITFHYEQIFKLTERGLFMDGIYGQWLDGLRTHLTSVRRTAAIRLIQTDLDRGLLDRVEEFCHKLLTADEFDEEALRGLFVVTARRRQMAKLMSLYNDYCKKLKQEFQTDPSSELRKLYLNLVSKESSFL
jgi:DNA-binding SARP family transcriptional activator/tetratricopeptide (TPR) repeat protein